jgi:hypothetical protein
VSAVKINEVWELTICRPHTASALTQACFHAHLLKSVLEGKMSLDTWSKETHELSSILIEGGYEIGRILMTSKLASAPRMQDSVEAFFGTQTRLQAKWEQWVEGDANGKM